MRFYVGLNSESVSGLQMREVFKADKTPTEDSHDYQAVIGPFRTKRGATFMAVHGRNNPHCQSVSDAERLAKRNAQPFARYKRR